VQRLRVAAADHLDHRAEVTPGRLRQCPVLADPSRRLVDLAEDVPSVAGVSRARVEWVLQLGSFGNAIELFVVPADSEADGGGVRGRGTCSRNREGVAALMRRASVDRQR